MPACKQEEISISEDESLLNLIFRDEIDQEADIFITANQPYPATGIATIVQAIFKNVKNKALTTAVNSFTINDSPINHGNIGGKIQYDNYYLSSNIFGTPVDINIVGNQSFPTVRQAVILPKLITFQSIPSKLIKSQEFNLSWSPTADTTSQVAIVLWYKGYKSNRIDPSLPSSNEIILLSAPDTGSYTIPQSQFINFPVGGIADVIIVRWREQVLNIDPVNDIELVVHAASICYSDELEIVQ